MSQRLTIQSHHWKHDLLRIDIRGALVSETVPILDGEFETRFREGHESFVLMLNQLTEISLAGGAALVGQLRVAQERAGSVTLVQPSPEVEQVFGILGVLPLLHIVRDTAELIGAGKARHHDAKPDVGPGPKGWIGRNAERRKRGSVLSHEPPRSTLYVPEGGPLGSTRGERA